MKMPQPDSGLIARRSKIAQDLRELIGDDAVLDDESERRPYESDGLAAYRALPLVVVLPDSTAQVQQILKYCSAQHVKLVPRGSGTSLSGGALPVEDAVLMSVARMSRIVEIDLENRTARVQPGVANVRITEAVKEHGLCFMPDPSSQAISSIGGNVAENSGGVHCLKYGVTSSHIVGVEAVLPDGEIVRMGGAYAGAVDGELDLCAALIGSEGLLAVMTEITVRLTPAPPAARVVSLGFRSVEEASRCVGAIIASGVIPAGLEFMDRRVIDAVSSMLGEQHPPSVEAILLCELDGISTEVDALIEHVQSIAQTFSPVDIRVSSSDAERERLWKGRKVAFGAMGKIARDVYVTDGTIPRSKLPDVLQRIDTLSKQYGLAYANCFHAGDGNLHPMVLFDSAKPGDLEKVEQFGADILKACVDFGGVLTGEHGVGVEKRDLMSYQFSDVDLAQQYRLKLAFDAQEQLNPGKMLPASCGCFRSGPLPSAYYESEHSGITRF
ncbi:FAD-linked oxidase C-terminal domain-containing protein [Paraburkholderia sp. GAS199]|uniref:FAD-linked oxidase C-terminal domain-containing protein n=1 Tax=Paraburkholderia sp. GAS199 TaxID=3035126 RepID=UPI003D1AFC34